MYYIYIILKIVDDISFLFMEIPLYHDTTWSVDQPRRLPERSRRPVPTGAHPGCTTTGSDENRSSALPTSTHTSTHKNSQTRNHHHSTSYRSLHHVASALVTVPRLGKAALSGSQSQRPALSACCAKRLKLGPKLQSHRSITHPAASCLPNSELLVL